MLSDTPAQTGPGQGLVHQAVLQEPVIGTHLSRTRQLDGVYLTSGVGPVGVVRALAEAGLERKVRIVCFDFFPETIRS